MIQTYQNSETEVEFLATKTELDCLEKREEILVAQIVNKKCLKEGD